MADPEAAEVVGVAGSSDRVLLRGPGKGDVFFLLIVPVGPFAVHGHVPEPKRISISTKYAWISASFLFLWATSSSRV